MIRRLNVKATVKNSGLYLAQHLATVDTEEGEIEILATGYGILLTFDGADKEVHVGYMDLVKEAIKEVA